METTIWAVAALVGASVPVLVIVAVLYGLRQRRAVRFKCGNLSADFDEPPPLGRRRRQKPDDESEGQT